MELFVARGGIEPPYIQSSNPYLIKLGFLYYYEGSSDTGNILSAKSENPVAALYVFIALSGTYIDPLKTSANPSVTVGGVSV